MLEKTAEFDKADLIVRLLKEFTVYKGMKVGPFEGKAESTQV